MRPDLPDGLTERSRYTMNANKELWEKGDFTRIAATMTRSGAELVGSLAITPRLKVLDLGCGDGTTAIPAARLGADVVGIDIASNLVAAGNRRAEAERLSNLRFVEGDASNLVGIADDTFDLTMTIFGAMFAPNPVAVASEMVRVTRGGGRIVMGNWIPGDPTLIAQLLKISAAYTPPPPARFISPVTWGVERNVLERFGRAGIAPDRIVCSRATYRFESSDSPAELVESFRTYYGPTMNAFEAATTAGRENDLRAELVDLFERHNGRAQAPVSIPATYLQVRISL
jgi:SAM-dependent methyltransferase